MDRRWTWLSFVLAVLTAACAQSGQQEVDRFTAARLRMVDQQIVRRGIHDPEVIAAMRKVPRHLFVPHALQEHAYQDCALPIGQGQTISQPYIVAFMTEALKLESRDKVLEIGTGSGYQAAVLAEIVGQVYTVELLPGLAAQAGERFKALGYGKIMAKSGDGSLGWPEQAPFDAVMITCAAKEIPAPLVDQLKEGGRLIMPRGAPGGMQKLVLAVKEKGSIKFRAILDVFFVPMLGDRGEEK